jgi:hypothetical protein
MRRRQPVLIEVPHSALSLRLQPLAFRSVLPEGHAILCGS